MNQRHTIKKTTSLRIGIALAMLATLITPTSVALAQATDAYSTAVLADNPVHYYRLGEATGPVATDLGTGATDGAYGSTTTVGAAGLLTNSTDTAAGFDGATATDFVDTGVTASTGAAFTVEAWVNANTIGTTGRRIVVKDEIGQTGEWLLWFNQGALRLQLRNATNTAWVIAEAPTTPLAGQTFHVAGVFDGTNAILYVDGVAVDSVALGTGTTSSGTLPITIGADSDPVNARGHIFDGTIDEVAIYGSALSPAAILAHFDAASVVSSVDLAVTKTVDNATPANGDTIVYTVTATNDGPDPATGVTVSDLLPAGVTYVSDDGGTAYVSGTGLWTVGSLAATGSATLNITATVAAAGGIVVDNTATISGNEADPNAANDTATASFTVSAAGVTFDLWATTGSLTLPDSSTVSIWGYATSAAGSAVPGGPILVATEGQTVTINLTNDLPETTALLLGGQQMVPDLIGAAAGGGTTSYTFTATNPGTYLYEAGLLPNAQHQVAMGMYGALIVRPANASQAYNDAATAFDDEAVLVLSEIDPNLNNSASPASFDMREYSPRYFLINGKAYPDTDAVPSAAGNKVLLRYVNAGNQFHSMALLGTNQTVVALDGNPLNFSRRFVAETLSPGQTADAIVTVPAAAVDGSKFAIYDGSLLLHNSNGSGFGGMLTFIAVAGTPPTGDTTGPVTSSVAFAAGTLTATVNDANTGGSTIAAAEYYLDSTAGAPTAMLATDGTFNAVSEAVTAAAVPGPGPHTLYVRGQDVLGNWGAFSSVVVNGGDVVGPITSSLTLTPNPSNGSTNVALQGTGNDSTTGGSVIIAAEYTIDGGTAVSMAVNVPATIASITANIPAATVLGLSEGPHSVAVRSEDSAGNWGAPVSIDLTVDKTGPTTSNVVANPNPNNGTLGINPLTPAVRLSAQLTDTAAIIAGAEGFIDTVGANGAGFQLVASDGLYNSLTESAFADIPLTTVVQLSPGNHTLYVHGRDAVGNWGAVDSVVFVIETDLPVVSGTTVTPATTDGTIPVALTASGSDTSSAIVLAEWFAGADPGVGNGTAMSVTANGPTWDLAATINAAGWVPGAYTISVRARDAAGNWSATNTATLTVTTGPPATPTLVYFSTLGGGNNNSVTGVPGPYDDADVYLWDTVATSFSRILDGSALGLAGNADIDGLTYVEGAVPGLGVYYISFNRNGGTTVPGAGGTFVAQDEDVVQYDSENGEWEPYFSGAECQLNGANGRDIDALHVDGGDLYFSTIGNQPVGGVAGPYDDADIYLWDGAGCSRVFDASAEGLPGGADIDGLTYVAANTFYVSFAGNVNPPGPLGTVQDEDVVFNDGGVWSVFFNATAEGMGASNGRDLDAIHVQ